MNIKYDADVDMLYIKLGEGPGVDSDEVTPGIVLDFAEGHVVVGIEITDASKLTDLSQFNLVTFPAFDKETSR